MAQWGGGGGGGTARPGRVSGGTGHGVSVRLTRHVVLVPAAWHVGVLSSGGGALSTRHAQQGVGAGGTS